MKTTITTTSFLLLVLLLSAQPNKRIAPALGSFLNTEFMLKFSDLKLAAESSAQDVVAREATFKPADMVKIRTAYNQTAQRANKMLEQIKQDFLDPKKLKSIDAFPDIYSDGLKLRLAELSEFYSANYQQALLDAQGEQLAGSPLLFIITEMINLTRGLAGYFRQLSREARLYTEDQLNQHLIKPHRWRYWNELNGPDGAPDHYTDYVQYQTNPTTVPGPDLPAISYDQWQNQLNQMRNPYQGYNPNPYDPNGYNGNYTPGTTPGMGGNDPNATNGGWSNTPPAGTDTLTTTLPPTDTLTTPRDTLHNGTTDPFQYPINPPTNPSKVPAKKPEPKRSPLNAPARPQQKQQQYFPE